MMVIRPKGMAGEVMESSYILMVEVTEFVIIRL